ncbi:MAG: hypothetical protein HOV87_25150 [Catenulispora sp.]|nr:hypothetical protein [Catenulispora sp.]
MFSTGAGADADSDIATDVPADELLVGAGLDERAPADEVGDGEVPETGAGDEESFFGMQSEGVVLTGIALGPGLRRLGRVCLAAALGLGVLFWLVLVLLYGYRVCFGDGASNPDMPNLVDDRPWTAYYLAGALWAVAVGAWGLATRGGYARLAWCFGCLVTAFFWPLGLAASLAVVAIRRPGAAMSRRLLLTGLAVLVAAGGLAWRVDAPATGPHQTAVSSDSALLGSWHSRSGITLELRPDGTFTAGSLSGGGRRDGDTIASASGRWESESADGHSGVRLLVDGDLSNSLYFDLYEAGPDLVLCSTNDTDEPCETVLRRT